MALVEAKTDPKAYHFHRLGSCLCRGLGSIHQSHFCKPVCLPQDPRRHADALQELTKCLPGDYHLLRVGSSSAFLERNTQSSQHLAEQVTETDDAIEWLHRMRSTLPDVVITNQLFSRPQKGQIDDGRHWERLLPGELFHFPRTRNVTVLL